MKGLQFPLWEGDGAQGQADKAVPETFGVPSSCGSEESRGLCNSLQPAQRRAELPTVPGQPAALGERALGARGPCPELSALLYGFKTGI